MGIASAIVVVAQLLSSYQSTNKLSDELKDLKDSIRIIKLDQETFVKKDQANSLQTKIEELGDDIKDIKKQLKKMRSDYVQYESGLYEDEVACEYVENPLQFAIERRI